MITLAPATAGSKTEHYAQLLEQARALVEGESDLIANLANLTSLLYHSLPDLNWVGTYRLVDGELVLGPFQGKPACIRIGMGRGVCGAAAERRATIVVPNVHEFDGHIACDAASNSEIVIPIVRDGEVRGVLDVDSPVFERFDDEDRAGLEAIAAIIDWSADPRS